MPDTPRTLWELVHQFFQGAYVGGHIDMTLFLNNVDAYGPDSLIGAQGRVVYTKEDVERAAAVYCTADADETGIEFDLLWRDDKPRYLIIARKAITAAGGVVADEVVEVGHYLSIPLADGSVHADPGDILYTVRAKEE